MQRADCSSQSQWSPLWFVCERSEVSCFTPHKQPRVFEPSFYSSLLSLSLTNTHIHKHNHVYSRRTPLQTWPQPLFPTWSSLMQPPTWADTISNPSFPSPSLPPFSFFLSVPQKNMINGIYVAECTPSKTGLSVAGHDLVRCWHISVSHIMNQLGVIFRWDHKQWSKLLSEEDFSKCGLWGLAVEAACCTNTEGLCRPMILYLVAIFYTLFSLSLCSLFFVSWLS